MHPMVASMATFAVSTIYLFWDAYRQMQARRQKRIRERVAYMLWVMANQAEE